VGRESVPVAAELQSALPQIRSSPEVTTICRPPVITHAGPVVDTVVVNATDVPAGYVLADVTTTTVSEPDVHGAGVVAVGVGVGVADGLAVTEGVDAGPDEAELLDVVTTPADRPEGLWLPSRERATARTITARITNPIEMRRHQYVDPGNGPCGFRMEGTRNLATGSTAYPPCGHQAADAPCHDRSHARRR
jgi:hypothetical protein